MVEINKSDLKDPTVSGWYLCKYSSSSITYFKEKSREVDYYLCNCQVRLLYWEQNVWIPNPRSYSIIEKSQILSWVKVQDEYNIYDEQIRINY